jgi:uncharacterized membrane protein YidH (DUF202 family)
MSISDIFAIFAWHIVAALFNSAASDTHPQGVNIIGALLTSSCLTIILWMAATAAKRRGYQFSRANLWKTSAVVIILYSVLVFAAFPMEKCF